MKVLLVIAASMALMLLGQSIFASSSVSLDKTAYPIDYAAHSLDFGRYQYHIPYKITGATIESMRLDCKYPSLIVQLNNSMGGSLSVVIPRKLLDATFNGNDVDFMTLADGKEIAFEETESNSESRMISIPFAKGVREVEIIDTFLTNQLPQGLVCGAADSEESPFYSLLPPLQQLRSGTSVDKIQCRQGLVLLVKSSDDSPACVKYETGSKLIKAGWAKCADFLEYRRGNPCGIESSPAVETPRITIPELIGQDSLPIPNTVSVILGVNNTVSWENHSNIGANMVSDDNTWRTGLIKPGDSFFVTFNETGKYPYHGEPWPWFRGTILVK